MAVDSRRSADIPSLWAAQQGNIVPLTARELQCTLWEAANILRGSVVDRTDLKGYILPLLFFKQICDVWDGEAAEAVETYGDANPSHFPSKAVAPRHGGAQLSTIRVCQVNDILLRAGQAMTPLQWSRGIYRSDPTKGYSVTQTSTSGPVVVSAGRSSCLNGVLCHLRPRAQWIQATPTKI